MIHRKKRAAPAAPESPTPLLEPLQVIEALPALTGIASQLGLDPEQRFALAGAFQSCGDQIIKLRAGEFIEAIDAGVIALARRHREDAETLAIIRRIQSAVHAVYARVEIST